MAKGSTTFLVSMILSIVILIGGTVTSCQSKPEPLVVPQTKPWESHFFRTIDQATNLADILALRKTSLNRSDLEVRVWRFALSLEGVILTRVHGRWTARYIKFNYEPNKIEPKALQPVELEWDELWANLEKNGILTLPDSTEIDCFGSDLDGLQYVVELGQNGEYRNYIYSSGKCRQQEQINQIGETIGLAFDDGSEQCRTTEWFACMTYRKKLNLKGE